MVRTIPPLVIQKRDKPGIVQPVPGGIRPSLNRLRKGVVTHAFRTAPESFFYDTGANFYILDIFRTVRISRNDDFDFLTGTALTKSVTVVRPAQSTTRIHV